VLACAVGDADGLRYAVCCEEGLLCSGQ
jgi:hypothetical protein